VAGYDTRNCNSSVLRALVAGCLGSASASPSDLDRVAAEDLDAAVREAGATTCPQASEAAQPSQPPLRETAAAHDKKPPV